MPGVVLEVATKCRGGVVALQVWPIVMLALKVVICN